MEMIVKETQKMEMAAKTFNAPDYRAYNFSAGPSMLPLSVMQRIQRECLNWDHGMSVMEVSHRSDAFVSLAHSIEQNVRDLLSVPENYNVLFIPGGATAQFAMIPMNLLGHQLQADYFDTGIWSQKAIEEAAKFCEVNIVASAKSNRYTAIPPKDSWQLNPDAAYCHYTPNETINGLAMDEIPDTGDVPLVADMSSCIFSRPIDVQRFGLIYAGSQKNLGPAGLTLVIIRKDLLSRSSDKLPSLYQYPLHAKYDSMCNTPPTFVWYAIGLVLDWIAEQGGLTSIAARNFLKAQKLYEFIDQSDFYSNPIEPAYRSWMNVPFLLDNPKLDAKFLQEAETRGLTNLAGHRLVGGMRASLYNAMPMEGVEALCSFMHEFIINL